MDLGCGSGYLANAIKEILPSVNIVGLDISDIAIQEAKIKYPELRFVKSDAEIFKLKTKFDVIVSYGVLEHLTDPFKGVLQVSSHLKRNGKIAMLRNYKEIFKSKFSIRFQFDMYHGNGNLDKAINLLPQKDKEDFKNYVRSNFEFNQGNMFISNSSSIINSYFSEVFDWLKKCESLFGFDLKGYNKVRMYTFLAERFLPFWFKKYTKALEWPVVYCDINKKYEQSQI